MARVYSQVLIEHVPGDGATQTFTVPDTVLWVIRDIVVAWQGGDDPTLNVYSLLAGEFDAVILYGTPTTDNTQVVEHWQGRQVVAAGVVVTAAFTTDTFYLRACGYALALP